MKNNPCLLSRQTFCSQGHAPLTLKPCCYCKSISPTEPLANRVTTVRVSVPFAVQSKILKKFPFLRFLTVLNNPKFCYALCICMPKQVGMIEQNDHHIFLEFGLSHTSHSKILDCLELLRTKEIENFYKSCCELKMEPKPEPWQP